MKVLFFVVSPCRGVVTKMNLDKDEHVVLGFCILFCVVLMTCFLRLYHRVENGDGQ